MKEEPSPSFPPEPPADTPVPKEPLGVLIVEDDREIRDMVSLMVRKMGHQVYMAATGKEALARLHEYRPDIVLLDIMMPEMDGFEFCRIVQAEETFRDLHIIITSARGALEDKVRGLELGAADFLTKPFSLTELRARIGVAERLVRHQKDLKQQQLLLEQMAREDKLTGLANRRYFEERAHAEYTRAIRYSHPLGLLLGDIDYFKQVNDRYGHPYGDVVLREIAQTLARRCRSSDLVARYGGEEFAILLLETDIEDAWKVAQRLCETVRGLTFPHPSGPVHVTMSFGVTALVRTQPQSLLELIEEADKALYAAKQQGRDRVERYPRSG